MSEPKLQGKSYDIPKQLVWDAWLKVKRNGGAAGADGVTIEQFEERLKDRLYKLWNRMSSIGLRRRRRCSCWNRMWSECSMTIPMRIGRGVLPWMRSEHAENGAGGRTGSSTLTSKPSSTPCRGT